MKFIREHRDGREIIVVPNHKILRKGTISGILKQLNLDIEKFKKLI